MLLFAGLLVTPLWLLDTLVMPQLNNLEYTYSHMDEIAARATHQ